jgi:hypothetical protein
MLKASLVRTPFANCQPIVTLSRIEVAESESNTTLTRPISFALVMYFCA